jgi:hypothetical protein
MKPVLQRRTKNKGIGDSKPLRTGATDGIADAWTAGGGLGESDMSGFIDCQSSMQFKTSPASPSLPPLLYLHK